jgi:hypothetical protein
MKLMSRHILIAIGIVGATYLPPICAQNPPEEGKFNFSAGGGLTIPLNPAATFSGVGGAFLGSAGYNLNRHSSLLGQFMWNGLPPNVGAKAQLFGVGASVNLYSITANYKFRGNMGKTFGYYFITGGGWYYRHTSVSQSVFVNAPIVCNPIWFWYGFTCTNGYVNTIGVATGTSSFGGNAGVGMTVRLGDSPWKFFLESRYIYAASRAINTQAIPVIFGFEFQ